MFFMVLECEFVTAIERCYGSLSGPTEHPAECAPHDAQRGQGAGNSPGRSSKRGGGVSFDGHGGGASTDRFAIFTSRSDPDSGGGLNPIRWQRQIAGTIEPTHDVLMNEHAVW